MSSESFENLSYEDRTFAPSAEFVANANAKSDIYEIA
jgi:acetyl-CoA synthetase